MTARSDCHFERSEGGHAEDGPFAWLRVTDAWSPQEQSQKAGSESDRDVLMEGRRQARLEAGGLGSEGVEASHIAVRPG